MNDKTRESVFPTTHNGSTLPGQRGMTLRDWFAGMAMQAQVPSINIADKQTREVIAERAYAMADAMLREREKK